MAKITSVRSGVPVGLHQTVTLTWPRPENFSALLTKLSRICRMRRGSPCRWRGTPGEMATSTGMWYFSLSEADIATMASVSS